VLRVAASGNGLIASASDDQTVRLWDMATSRTRHKLQHGSGVRSLALSPDGRKLVSGCQDGHLRLWDTNSGKLIYTLPGGRPIAVGFTAEGKQFLSLDERLFLVTWDVATGKAVTEHQIQPAGAKVPDPDNSMWRLNEENAAFSPDGKVLILSLGGYRIFEVSSGKEVRQIPIPGPNLPMQAGFNLGSTVVSPNNQYLLAVTGQRWREVKGPDGRIEETIESPLMCLWELPTGRLCRHTSLPGALAGPVAFRPDGQVFAVAPWTPYRQSNKISLFDLVSGRELRSFDGLTSKVDSLTFTPDGKRLVTGMNDSSALVWDVADK
jgi:WD40 repeat protein